MENNKLNELYNESKLKEKMRDSEPLLIKYDLSPGTTPRAIIVKTKSVGISIPRGFKRIGSQAIEWQESIDKHDVEIIATYEELLQESYQGINLVTERIPVYHVQLVGSIHFNVTVLEFEPVETVTGTAHSGIFNAFGSIALNEDLGYVTSYEQVVLLAAQNIDIGVGSSTVNSIGESGGGIPYDPENSEPFYASFDGQGNRIFSLEEVLLIAVGGTISS